MNVPTLLLCLALSVLGFMLIWDGDAGIRACDAAGIQSRETCEAAFNP